MFISIYMFRATLCPSSGETTVFVGIWYWYLLFCMDECLVWVFGIGICYSVWMNVWYAGRSLHTRQSSVQNNKYQGSHKYSNFSCWWAHSRPKLPSTYGGGERRVQVLVVKPEGIKPLGRPIRRWQDNIKKDLLEVECGGYGMDRAGSG